MGFTAVQIHNVVDFRHLDFPEWFTKKGKNYEHILSTLDDCAIRYRIKGEDFDKILIFGRGSAVRYSSNVHKIL